MLKKIVKVIAGSNSHHFEEHRRHLGENVCYFFNRLVLSTDTNRKMSFSVVNSWRTTHGSPATLFLGETALIKMVITI